MERPVSFRDPFTILEVADIRASMRFYCELLGFERSYQFPPEGEPGFVVVGLGGVGIGLSQKTDEPAVAGGPIVNTEPFEVCIYTSDVDGAAAWLAENGVKQLLPPTDQPWGERLTYFEDPDGNRVHITAPIE